MLFSCFEATRGEEKEVLALAEGCEETSVIIVLMDPEFVVGGL